MKMRCAHLGGLRQSLVQSERPLARPEHTQVLLKVLGAGMCHSDVHLWEGSYDLAADGNCRLATGCISLSSWGAPAQSRSPGLK